MTRMRFRSAWLGTAWLLLTTTATAGDWALYGANRSWTTWDGLGDSFGPIWEVDERVIQYDLATSTPGDALGSGDFVAAWNSGGSCYAASEPAMRLEVKDVSSQASAYSGTSLASGKTLVAGLSGAAVVGRLRNQDGIELSDSRAAASLSSDIGHNGFDAIGMLLTDGTWDPRFLDGWQNQTADTTVDAVYRVIRPVAATLKIQLAALGSATLELSLFGSDSSSPLVALSSQPGITSGAVFEGVLKPGYYHFNLQGGSTNSARTNQPPSQPMHGEAQFNVQLRTREIVDDKLGCGHFLDPIQSPFERSLSTPTTTDVAPVSTTAGQVTTTAPRISEVAASVWSPYLAGTPTDQYVIGPDGVAEDAAPRMPRAAVAVPEPQAASSITWIFGGVALRRWRRRVAR